MEAKTDDVTTIDVSAIASTTTRTMVMPHAQPSVQINPGSILNGSTEYRHAIQKHGETSVMCSLCMGKFQSFIAFGSHTCLVESVLSPSSVVFITEGLNDVVSAAAVASSTTTVETCTASVQTSADMIAKEMVGVKEGGTQTTSTGTDMENNSGKKTKVKSSPSSASVAEGNTKLPIFLPNFLKVKKELERKGATQCEECNSKYKTTEELVNHMKKHTGANLYKCPDCPSVFNKPSSLQRHVKKHTEGKITACTVCSEEFQSPESCAAHMRTHYGKKAHVCEDCNKVFSYRKDYNIHRRSHSGERPYKCEQCPAAFAQKGHLSRHIKTHSGERPHHCDECGATFAIRYRLIEHWRTHTKEKPYTCNICDTSFSHLNTLKFHKRKHTGERPYECQYCGNKFSHQTHLKVHIRTHTGEKPYKCETCQAAYSRKSLLVIHQRKHTGERPFKCTDCSAAFAQRNYLRDHMRVHTGEKPFHCDVCQQAFSQRTSLRLHRKNHFNPSTKKTTGKAPKKEGNMIDRMISNLGRNKQQRTRQAKEAALKIQQEGGLTLPVALNRGDGPEDQKAGDFVVLGLARVEDAGITEAEVNQLDHALQQSSQKQMQPSQQYATTTISQQDYPTTQATIASYQQLPPMSSTFQQQTQSSASFQVATTTFQQQAVAPATFQHTPDTFQHIQPMSSGAASFHQMQPAQSVVANPSSCMQPQPQGSKRQAPSSGKGLRSAGKSPRKSTRKGKNAH